MAVDITAIGLGVETAKLRQGTKDLDAFGRSANNAAGKADQSTQSMGAMASIAGKLAIVLGAAGLAKSLITVIDANTKYTAQLKLATQSQQQFNTALADVQRIARTAQSDIASVATLYARLNSSLRDVGVTQQEVARITENVGLALKVSGATAAESSSAILQLSQAFASGVLRGEEFNAVSESAPALMRALAESIGVPIGQLRAMAAEGQITGEVLNRAFGDEKLLEKFRQQAKEVNTIAGAFQQLKNSLTILVGQVSTSTSVGVSFAEILSTIARNIESVANVIKGDLKGAFDSILPAYERFKLLQEKERLNLPVARGDEGNILGRGSRIDEPLKRDLGLINDNTNAFAGLREQFNKFKAENPLKDLTSANEEYNQSIALVRANVLAMNISPEEGRRYEEQLKKSLNSANKIKDEKTKEQLENEATQRINAYVSMQNELNDLTTKYQKISMDTETKIINETREAKIKSEKEFLDIKQKLANDNFKEAQDAAKKEADDYNKIFERANDNLSRSITDSIVRGFERGEKFIDNFKNSITNSFRGYFVNIGVNFAQEQLKNVVGGLGKSILGAIGLGGSGAAVAGDGVATAGLLDSAKGVFDVITKGFDGANAALQGSIESFGAFLSNGQGGIFDAIGGAIGQYSSVISGALPYAGAVLKLLQGDVKGAAFTGGGAAIGSLVGGPVGGAIGAALGSALGGMFGGKKQPPRTVTQLPQVSEQFNAQLSTLLGGFGLANNVSSSAEYRGRGGGSGYGTLISNVNGSSQHRAIQYKDAYGEATMQQFIQTALTTYLVQSIQKTDLSQAIKNLFSGLTDNTQIQSMIQATIMLKQANTALSDRFGLTTDTAAELAKQSGLAGEELVNLVAQLAQAAGAFTTPAQQLIKFRDTLTTNLGRSLPATIDAFDAILKSFNTTTQAGKDLFLTMFGLREQFIQFTTGLDAIKKGVSDSVFTLLSPAQQQAMNRSRLSEEFAKFNIEVPQSIQQLIAIGQGLDFTTEAGLNLALAFPSLVQAFQAVNGQVNSLTDSLNNLNPNLYKTSADYRTAQAYAGAGMAIPSYAVGTDFVPNDGLAMLHKGEKVVTAKENKEGDSKTNSVLAAKIENLNRAIEVVATQTYNFAKIIKKWDNEGLPVERIV